MRPVDDGPCRCSDFASRGGGDRRPPARCSASVIWPSPLRSIRSKSRRGPGGTSSRVSTPSRLESQAEKFRSTGAGGSAETASVPPHVIATRTNTQTDRPQISSGDNPESVTVAAFLMAAAYQKLSCRIAARRQWIVHENHHSPIALAGGCNRV